MNISTDKRANAARKKIIEVAERVEGAHIGGSFSIIDFMICLYDTYLIDGLSPHDLYEGKFSSRPKLAFSKGHCYLAQLAALDVTCGQDFYVGNYMKSGGIFFGHPKRIDGNDNFTVSTGALGQGLTFANGVALSEKMRGSSRCVISIIGDGELNEGSCWEAIDFAQQHQLQHLFVIDNNNQMSLGRTTDILGFKNITNILNAANIKTYEIDGHSHEAISGLLTDLILNKGYLNGPACIVLNTIKGKGVSFMESDFKWHHRRFKNDEYQLAKIELEKNEK